MIRNFLSVTAGLLTGFAAIILSESFADVFFLPAGVDLASFRDPERLRDFIHNAPAGFHLFILGGYAVGSFLSSFIAATIIKTKKLGKAMTMGGILMALGIGNMLNLHHPIWSVVLAFLAFLPFSYLAGQLAIRIAARKEQK